MRTEIGTRQVITDPQTSQYRVRRLAMRLMVSALLCGITLGLLSGAERARAMPIPAPARALAAPLGNVGAGPILSQPLLRLAIAGGDTPASTTAGQAALIPIPTPAPSPTLPIPTPPQTDPWRLVLIGVLVVLAGVFVVRGIRRQRRP